MKRLHFTFLYLLIVYTGIIYLFGCSSHQTNKDASPGSSTVVENTSLQLPQGFTAVIVADSVGKARHLAVNSKGDIYIKLAALKNGKGIVYLHNTNGDGKTYEQTSFGDYGGTGIYIRDNYLYASSNEAVYRYRLNKDGQIIQPDKPELIVEGLIDRGEHNSKSIVLDHNGNIYVNIGAYSNACQVIDRTEGSPGQNPCPILDSAGGIWQFKANQPNQSYNNGIRYATGLRNVVGLDWNDEDNQLFVMQHGRDQLYQLFPKLYSARQGAELPAETMYALNKGDDCGWPYIYYDQLQKK